MSPVNFTRDVEEALVAAETQIRFALYSAQHERDEFRERVRATLEPILDCLDPGALPAKASDWDALEALYKDAKTETVTKPMEANCES